MYRVIVVQYKPTWRWRSGIVVFLLWSTGGCPQRQAHSKRVRTLGIVPRVWIRCDLMVEGCKGARCHAAQKDLLSPLTGLALA